LNKHPGNGQTVAAIVSLPAKDGKWVLEKIVLFDPLHACLSGSFHQIKGRDWFILDSVLIPFPDLLGIQDFHYAKVRAKPSR
jgi:hypothetical protein